MDFYDPQTQDFVEPLEKYRFFEVIADVPDHFPWHGNGLYILEVVEYLLEKGIIAKQNVTRALQHTIEIPMETFKAADKAIEETVYESIPFSREYSVKQILKSMRLKFLGLAGRTSNKHWTVTESVCFHEEEDGVVSIKAQRPCKESCKNLKSVQRMFSSWGRRT